MERLRAKDLRGNGDWAMKVVQTGAVRSISRFSKMGWFKVLKRMQDVDYVEKCE